jgi:hypothetical protein
LIKSVLFLLVEPRVGIKLRIKRVEMPYIQSDLFEILWQICRGM